MRCQSQCRVSVCQPSVGCHSSVPSCCHPTLQPAVSDSTRTNVFSYSVSPSSRCIHCVTVTRPGHPVHTHTRHSAACPNTSGHSVLWMFGTPQSFLKMYIFSSEKMSCTLCTKQCVGLAVHYSWPGQVFHFIPHSGRETTPLCVFIIHPRRFP